MTSTTCLPVPRRPRPASRWQWLSRMAADRSPILWQALRRLPAHQRVPLVLFLVDGMRCEDIAARLRVSVRRIRIDIARGRDALGRSLAGAPEGG